MKPYLKYLFEVLAIVVGITISFMVDELRDQRKEESIEIVSLNKLLVGLKADSARLTGTNENKVKQYIAQWRIYSHLEGDRESILPDSLWREYHRSFAINLITLNDFIFRELEYSGNITKIHNDEIRVLLNHYYNNNAVNTWNPLLKDRNWKVNDLIQTRTDLMYGEIAPISMLMGGEPEIDDLMALENIDSVKQSSIQEMKNILDQIDYNDETRFLVRNSMRTTVELILIQQDLLELNTRLSILIEKDLEELGG